MGGAAGAGGAAAGGGVPGVPFPINEAGMRYVVDTGRQYVEGTVARIINLRALRRYFAVSTDYVRNKLKLVLLPYSHRGSWQRSVIQTSTGEEYPPPRADINAPDLYVPVMGFITYIVLCAIVAGVAGAFKPELLGLVATKALVVVALDVAALKLGFYLLSNSAHALLDCAALCGYVFVGVALNELAQLAGGRWLLYPTLVATGAGMAVFLVRTVRVALLADPAPIAPGDYAAAQQYAAAAGAPVGYADTGYDAADSTLREHKRRRYFLLFLGLAQVAVMYFLAFVPRVAAAAAETRPYVVHTPAPQPPAAAPEPTAAPLPTQP